MTSDLFFETLESHFNKNLPFVAFRNPNKKEIKSYLQKNDVLHIASDFTESGFVFAPFDADEKAIFSSLDVCDILVVNDFVLDENVSFQTIKPLLSDEVSKNNHIQLVKKGIEATISDKFQKIGRASCRERVKIKMVGAALKKKRNNREKSYN